MKTLKLISLVLNFVLISNAVCAQMTTQEIEAKAIEIKPAVTAFTNALNAKVNFTPFGEGNLANTVSNISLRSSFTEGEKASIDLVYKPVNKLVTNAGFRLVQALDKEAKQTSFLDLHGVTGGTTVGFSLQFGDSIKIDNKDVQRFISEYDQLQLAGKKALSFRNVSDVSALYNGPMIMKDPLLNMNTKSSAFLRFAFDLSKTDHEYAVDSVSLAKTKESHLSPSIVVTFGKKLTTVFKNNCYLSFAYKYSIGYENADKQTFLSPFGTTANMISRSLVFGAPEKQTENMVNVEYRQNLGIKYGDRSFNFGIAPVITMGFESKKWSFVFPIYLIKGVAEKGKAEGLQGGLKFGYTGNMTGKSTPFKDGFAAQIIASLPFNLFEEN